MNTMFKTAALCLVGWGAYALFSNKNGSTEAKNSSSIFSLFRSFFSVAPKPAMPLNPPPIGKALETNSPVSTIASKVLTPPAIPAANNPHYSPKPAEPASPLLQNPKPLSTVASTSPEKPKFKQKIMPTDGNCFFHCLAHHSDIPHSELRGLVPQFLDANRTLPEQIAQKIRVELADITAGLVEKIQDFILVIPFLPSGQAIDPEKEFSHVTEFQPFIQLLNFKKKPKETVTEYLTRLTQALNCYAIKIGPLDRDELNLFKTLVSRDKFHAGQGVTEIMACQLGVGINVYSFDQATLSYVTHPQACSNSRGEATIHLQRDGNHFNYLELMK
ncbi:MAG: hypothetical protein ACOYL1_02925 [Chlamydiia bacterium]